MLVSLFFVFLLMGSAAAAPIQLIDSQTEESMGISDLDAFNAAVTDNNKESEEIQRRIHMNSIFDDSIISSDYIPQKTTAVSRKDMSVDEYKRLLKSGIEKGVDKLTNKLTNIANTENKGLLSFVETPEVIFVESNKKLMIPGKNTQFKMMEMDNNWSNKDPFVDSKYQPIGSLSGSSSAPLVIIKEKKTALTEAELLIRKENRQEFNQKFMLFSILSIVLFLFYQFKVRKGKGSRRKKGIRRRRRRLKVS